MKALNPIYIILFLLIIFISSSFYKGKDRLVTDIAMKDITTLFKDGIYEGSSRSKYVGEPFWGNVRINIKNGLLTEIIFTIRDSALHESFNENYEKHFLGDSLYTQQCRNDWYGVRNYPERLMKVQNPDKVDAFTGATWSYNIFKASAKKALKDAIIQPDTLPSR